VKQEEEEAGNFFHPQTKMRAGRFQTPMRRAGIWLARTGL